MFTGLVADVGVVVAAQDLPDDARRLRIRSAAVAPAATPGASICVDGVCLTVVDPAGDEFGADVMKETLDRSSLGGLVVGSRVNLEPAMGVGDRFGGHIVSGHVDGRAEVVGRQDAEHWRVVELVAPPELRRFIAEKGSVTLDGVSLTVASVTDEGFTVSLIPTTLAETTLGERQPGDLLNLEIDMLARYVARLLESA
jgi:riboflavin synthase